ncbi:30S ribosomal protein S17 [Bryobacter aggregatus]|uniref:30S ribosomal protein S17 n=1 Tax=Bryobacter aggregatus TaxID=360054 RepID=UPI0004E13CC1|nr:30S ribosomal protein S17 [Bryobacter aggregatus]
MAETAVKQPNKQEKVGEVISTKMAKTIIVEVTRKVQHPLYKRILTRRNKFYAHDEEGKAKMGDQVRIIESRPLSKLKRWQLAEVLREAVRIAIVDGPSDERIARAAAVKSAKKNKK